MNAALRFSYLQLSLIVLMVGCVVAELPADIVSISTSSATGSQARADKKRFVGILDVTPDPMEVLGEEVEFKDIPSLQSFLDGDLVGSEMDRAISAGGGRNWEYLISLPTDAVGGTGLENIHFSGFAIERDRNNLEGTDELTWQLFLNNDLIAIDSSTTGAGIDFDTHTISFSNSGGANIHSARVVFNVNGFDEGEEWFATRGTLSATYTAVPESVGSLMLVLGCVNWLVVRRRRRD